MQEIKIMICGNDRVFHGMLLTLISIAKHSKEKIKLYIGTMDLTDIDERYRPITETMRLEAEAVLKRANPDSSASIIDFGNSFRRELAESKNIGTSYTPYTMIRLFADELEELDDKLLYLDTDVLIKGDISELYSTDLEGYHLAGALDFIGKFCHAPRYLNAGVLLFNMKEMRRDGIFKKCRERCNSKKMLLVDQDAINKYAAKKLVLSRRFNEQHRTCESTLIRHFSMTIRLFPYPHTENVKPWQTKLVHERLGDRYFDDIFEEYEKYIFPKETLYD